MEWVQSLDQGTACWFAQFWGSGLDSFMLNVTSLGSRPVLGLVVLFAVGLLLCGGRYRSAGFLLGASVGGALLSRAVKEATQRPRPGLHHPLASFEGGLSFPSGHSMLSAVIYLTLALIVAELAPRRMVRAYLVGCSLLLVLLIGLSRLYLGVHYLTDVLAGWAGGLAWALLCRWVEARWVLRSEAVDER